MAPERDLSRLLGAIMPQRHAGVYVFCDVPAGSVPRGIEPQLIFREDGTTTVVITEEQAEASGLVGVFPCAWITLGVSSDLTAVGFLAVITARMAEAGISVNVVSAFHHDHLFVPVAMADEAMSVLTTLEEMHRPAQMTTPLGGAIEVRPASVDDAEALVALWEVCGLRFDSTRVISELQSCIRLHGELVLVAVEQAAIVGSVWATYDGRRGWIQRLATDPARRGLGIGAALMAGAEYRLALLGAAKVNLLIEPENAAVAGFYAPLGYQRDELTFMEHWLTDS
jgi:ribosomal protein S18 acetylase RimI-like enzyme